MAIWSQDHRRRRRRRSRSANIVSRPVVINRRQFKLRSAEALASVGVLIAALTLVVLVWLIESNAVEAERTDVRARTEVTLTGQSLLLSDQIRREMLGVEQSLRILRQAFQADPEHFDMRAWRDQMPALTDVADNAFIADDSLVLRHNLTEAEIGLGIGSRVAGLFGPAADRDDGLQMGPTVQKVQTRQHVTFMMLRVERPAGWIVGASYRTSALSRLFNEVGLGLQGMTALIDRRLGRVQAIAGPAPASDQNYDVAKSAMYAAMQLRPDGTWIGPSAIDGVQRIHAFHRVPGQQLSVVVAINEQQALQPAIAWAEAARSVTLAATLVIALATGLALVAVWTYRARRRLRESLMREEQLVVDTRYELGEMRTRMQGRTSQVQSLFSAIDDGALLLNIELLIVEWNQALPGLLGAACDELRVGRPLDELLRSQINQGLFGPVEDIEAEVARRTTQLLSDTSGGVVLYHGAGNRLVAVRVSRHLDGSVLLLLREPTESDLQQPPAVLAKAEAEASGSVESL